jgi:PST family polysaccharide transporter
LRKIAHNVTLLFIAQAVGYLIPVFEIPVLARSLGPEAYGKLVMVQALALMASLFVEYGFGISAARQVALVSDDKHQVTEIFGQVLSAKLMVSGVIIVLLVLWLILKGHAVLEVHLVVFGIFYFLAFGLSPVWLFQGVEQLSMITLVDVLLRCFGLFLLVVLIKDQEDYDLALGILASVSILNTSAGCCLCAKWVSQLRLTVGGGLSQIKSGFHVFIYKGAGNVLLNAGAPLVSLFSGVQALAYYSPAEKIVRSLAGLATPVLSGMFPYLSRLGVSNRLSSVCSCLVIAAVLFVAGMVVAVVVIIFGRTGLALLLGDEFEGAAELLSIFVWLIPFRLANQAMGLTGLIVMGRQKLLARLTLMSSVCAVGCSATLGGVYGAVGVIIGFIAAEVILFVFLISIVLRLWFTNSAENN